LRHIVEHGYRSLLTCPPILLCDAGYYGTLAAARSLGRAGVPVVVVDPTCANPTRFSRYVRRSVVCPPVTSVQTFVDWLLSFGAHEGTHVLYPTSDEVAYVFSAYRDELSKFFGMYQPPLETIVRTLDKKELFEAGRRAGFDVPMTWFPENPEDVERAAREADGPLMIKPRTQLFLKTHKKGAVASRDPVLLRSEYSKFEHENTYGRPLSDDRPELTRPVLQRYYAEAIQSIHSVTGFRDRSDDKLVLLGAVKVLQRPKRMGVGLCFEQSEVRADVRAALARLLDDFGYYGVFEIELVRVGDRLLLIDMNPRFYNQIGLDIVRGLPLALLAYRAALGDEAEVSRLLAGVPSGEAPHAFCNSVGLFMLVHAQRAFGTMSAEDARAWRRWMRDRRDILVDSVRDADDPAPFWAEAAVQLYGTLRHPRAFLRMIALDR
jgi:D-aspartate ligase